MYNYRSGVYCPEDEYINLLQLHKNAVFHSRPYPGNSGDLLIRNGTLKLLSDLEIKTTDDAGNADVILYPGGCPTMWPVVMNCIEKTFVQFSKAALIIGPATFEFGITNWPAIFKTYASRIIGLFAREPKSFSNLRDANLPPNIYTGLSHDPALYLLNTEWLKTQKALTTEEYVLAAFRRDHEVKCEAEEKRIRFIKPLLSEKISKKLIHWVRKRAKRKKVLIAGNLADSKFPLKDIEVWRLDFDNYIDTIRRAKEVHTDRLHVMLFAAMLGKPIFAYETCYGKLETIYEHSLKGWANVTFIPT